MPSQCCEKNALCCTSQGIENFNDGVNRVEEIFGKIKELEEALWNLWYTINRLDKIFWVESALPECYWSDNSWTTKLQEILWAIQIVIDIVNYDNDRLNSFMRKL